MSPDDLITITTQGHAVTVVAHEGGEYIVSCTCNGLRLVTTDLGFASDAAFKHVAGTVRRLWAEALG